MLESPTCYISPKLEGRNSPKNGRGVFARIPIAKGEVLVVFGGEVITYQQLMGLPPVLRRVVLQVEESLYLLTSREGPGDWVNHSCDPNAGLSGQITLLALRPIAANEEICYDYAMSEGSFYDDFTCHCATAMCRNLVTGHDWELPDLQQRYQGYFSPYLQRRIIALKAAEAAVGGF